MGENPSQYVTCRCQNCDGHIEFDATGFIKGETRTVDCPHCHLDTVIFLPAVIPKQVPKIPPQSAKTSRSKLVSLQMVLVFLSGMMAVLIGLFLVRPTLIHQKSPSRKDFTALKRDLAEMSLALDAGITLESGLARFDDFKKSLDVLQVDIQLQDPKPSIGQMEQFIADSKTIIKEASLYQGRATQIQNNLTTQADAIDYQARKIFYLVEPPTEVMRNITESNFLNFKIANWEKALSELTNQCLNSVEWQRLKTDYEKFHPAPSQMLAELKQEEGGLSGAR